MRGLPRKVQKRKERDCKVRCLCVMCVRIILTNFDSVYNKWVDIWRRIDAWHFKILKSFRKHPKKMGCDDLKSQRVVDDCPLRVQLQLVVQKSSRFSIVDPFGSPPDSSKNWLELLRLTLPSKSPYLTSSVWCKTALNIAVWKGQR